MGCCSSIKKDCVLQRKGDGTAKQPKQPEQSRNVTGTSDSEWENEEVEVATAVGVLALTKPEDVGLSFSDEVTTEASSSSSIELCIQGVSAARLADQHGKTSIWFGVDHSDESAYLSFANNLPCSSFNAKSKSVVFEYFRTASRVDEIYSTFSILLSSSGTGDFIAPWSLSSSGRCPYHAIRDSMQPNPWKADRLWKQLDEKASGKDYALQPCRGKRFVIVGAGPCGLRAAIELRILGATVIVLEKRTSFERINRLHLWDWCSSDLKQLSARCQEPPARDFGTDPDLIHIGIGELQTFLFKTALLFGVCVLLGAEYEGHEYSDSTSGWKVLLGSVPDDKALPGPRPPECIANVDVLIGADGLGGRFKQNCGIKSTELGVVASGSAIGLVFNFENRGSPAEKRIRGFNFARQFYEDLFRSLAEKTGVTLENIVYTPSPSTSSHYFVLTPTLQCLADIGVILNTNVANLLDSSNINSAKLEELCYQIARFPFKSQQQTLAVAVGEENLRFCEGSRPALFDFSKMKRAQNGATINRPPGCSEGPPLLSFLIGDALLEPFWPEGLGIIRGFFSGLDLASALAAWCTDEVDAEGCVNQFALSFAQLKSLTAKTRDQVLVDRSRGADYSVAPTSRYRSRSTPVSVRRGIRTDGTATDSVNGRATRQRASSVHASRGLSQ